MTTYNLEVDAGSAKRREAQVPVLFEGGPEPRPVGPVGPVGERPAPFNRHARKILFSLLLLLLFYLMIDARVLIL